MNHSCPLWVMCLVGHIGSTSTEAAFLAAFPAAVACAYMAYIVAGIEIFLKKYLHKVQIPPALWHVYLHTCRHIHGCACIFLIVI